ncbi:isocitrate lyase/PEP mutase family protein [Roseateles sp. NT4]|uniref:isocitrate lyase/PEP mutase family protein n=1 Tax=Roseateles sp. NT4 TaxID=3453715 RepID=UPI003EEDC10B
MTASAALLHRLHQGPAPLVLVNAWDAGSARLLEQAGSAAIATSSAGMAWSLGYADGERLPRAKLLAAVARICRVVSVPVTVDIERGQGATTAEVLDFARQLAALGVAGLNIEDGLGADGLPVGPQIACERIAALRSLGLFINVRTDVFLAPLTDAFDDGLRRARLYAEAGADGIFVPGLGDVGGLARLARAIDKPLNAYAGYPGAPSVAALAAVGVRRVSLGCAPAQAAYGLLGRIAAQTLQQGRVDELAGMAAVDAMNGLFS